VIGGGSATCDQATFDAWITAYGEQADVDGATLPAGEYRCADGWAVMFPAVGTSAAATSFTENVIVQAQGPNWALMDRGKVCGDSEESSQVPAAIYALACETNERSAAPLPLRHRKGQALERAELALERLDLVAQAGGLLEA
jgi:hypothetical protein